MTTPPKLTKKQYVAFLFDEDFSEAGAVEVAKHADSEGHEKGKKRAREEEEKKQQERQDTGGPSECLRRSARIAAQALKQQGGR